MVEISFFAVMAIKKFLSHSTQICPHLAHLDAPEAMLLF